MLKVLKRIASEKTIRIILNRLVWESLLVFAVGYMEQFYS